jgi:hypothetical protein
MGRTLPLADQPLENVNVLSKDLPSFPDQITKYVTGFGRKSAVDDLCIIWIGANDFSAGIDPAQTVTNIKDGITKFSQAGARTFAVINIPESSPKSQSICDSWDFTFGVNKEVVGIVAPLTR